MFQPLLKSSACFVNSHGYEWLAQEPAKVLGIFPAYPNQGQPHRQKFRAYSARLHTMCDEVQANSGSSGLISMRQSRIYGFGFSENMTKTCAYRKARTEDHCFHVPLPTENSQLSPFTSTKVPCGGKPVILKHEQKFHTADI